MRMNSITYLLAQRPKDTKKRSRGFKPDSFSISEPTVMAISFNGFKPFEHQEIVSPSSDSFSN